LTIFEIIDGIAFSKKNLHLENIGEENSFQLFMVNRWLSMLDPSCAKIINDTTNRYGGVFDNNTQKYNFLVNVLPKYRKQKIYYIKKQAS